MPGRFPALLAPRPRFIEREFARRRNSAVVGAFLCALLLSCASRPTACLAPPDCGEGYECLAARCVPLGGEPVPEQSRRDVLLPEQLAVAGSLGVPDAARLGPPDREALYLSFRLPAIPCGALHSAFLLLAPSNGGYSTNHPVEFEVRRIDETWSSEDVSEGSLPHDTVPGVVGLLNPPTLGRVDVTALICRDLELPSKDHGMVVRASGKRPVTISTGLGAGPSPTLELYVAR